MNELTPLAIPSIAETAHAVLRGRRSIRSYRPERPPHDMIERIFASVALAPSAHNRQPWRFLVMHEAALKTRLARAMGTRLAADRRADGESDELIQRDVERSLQHIGRAPIVILIAMTVAEMDRYPDAVRARAEHLMAVQSTAMATQNLLLAAHAEGLGACCMCAPLFCEDAVREALSIPADWVPQGLVTLGWPANGGKKKPRKPISEFVVFADLPFTPELHG